MKISKRKILLLLWVIAVTFLAIVLLKYCNRNISSSPAKKEHDAVLPHVYPTNIINTNVSIIKKKAKELDNKFKRLQRLTGFNGTVLYAEKGIVILKKAYGWCNVLHQRNPLKVSNQFQLASVSKMFSAYAIMLLKKDGKIDYDKDIRKYLSGFPYKGITTRLLMNHRSGLPRYMSLAQKTWKDKKLPLDNDAMLAMLIKYHPNRYFAPNTGFHYCNTNYALLANIVEAISGMHFEDFIRKRIFIPLGMDSSFVYNMRHDSVVPLYVKKGVSGWYHRGWRWRRMTNDYLNGVLGDKNIYTSVEDLYKFDISLDNFELLPDSILREAFTPGSPHYWKRRDNYGFGWRIRSGMDSTVYHFGWWKGFRTFYIRDMKHHKTLIVLTNKDRGPGSDNFWNIIKEDTLPIAYSIPLNIKSK